MARLNVPDGFDVVVRRFLQQPLSGGDLKEMRHSLLGLSQEDLGGVWDMSRNQIYRIEAMEAPSQRFCDCYLGLMLRLLLQRQELQSIRAEERVEA